MNQKTQTTIAGYTVEESGILLNAPCGCPQCREDGRQPGHRYCDNVPPALLQAEAAGKISANLGGSGWYWQTR